jgi:hypothetical protein
MESSPSDAGRSGECGIVKNSGFSLTLAATRTAELRGEMFVASIDALKTVHLIPRGERWVLIGSKSPENGTAFPDLGRALDAATRGDARIHVVVHERRED